MAGWQVTVENGGPDITVGGILFSTGSTTVHVATLELLVTLGLINQVRTPLLTFDLGDVDAMAALSVHFTMTAAATIV